MTWPKEKEEYTHTHTQFQIGKHHPMHGVLELAQIVSQELIDFQEFGKLVVKPLVA